MKIIAGCFSLAMAKASLTSLAPSPMNICTNCGPASFKNVDLVCAAQARASSVLPVPGGPYSNTPGKIQILISTIAKLNKKQAILRNFDIHIA